MAEHKDERKCRQLFEDIFVVEFPKAKKGYLEWLINDSGNPMELDGYNEDLNLAFEYQGQQHEIAWGTETQEHFEQRMRDDDTKKKLCKKHGVMLILVGRKIKPDDRKDYIVKMYEEMSSNKVSIRKIARGEGQKVKEPGEKKPGKTRVKMKPRTRKCKLRSPMIREVLIKFLQTERTLDEIYNKIYTTFGEDTCVSEDRDAFDIKWKHRVRAELRNNFSYSEKTGRYKRRSETK